MATFSTPVPWLDRWTKPTLAQLLDPLKVHNRRQFDRLIAALATFDDIDQTIMWYGPSWKWSLQYTYTPALCAEDEPSVTRGKGRTGRTRRTSQTESQTETLCYLVPRLEMPLVCVPLTNEMVEMLSHKRLSGFVRDGVRVAKCAVDTHWATWTPNSEAECEHLMDLLKRKMKFAPEEAQAEAAA